MKGFRKSTRIAYWVLRALAISSALLLFSITGIVALQPASHAIGTTAKVILSPLATMTPTPTASSTPAPDPTATPLPTAQPTKPPTPTSTPTPKKPPAATPTPIPPISTAVPIVVATPTSAAIGPGVPPLIPTVKGTPKVTPSPTPSGSPTANPTGTPVSTSTGGPSTTQPNANGGIMATIKPLMGPIAGISTTILLGSASLLALMFWRKRTAAQGAAPSFAQAPVAWGGTQVPGSTQATELAPAQNRPMLPFAMQSIAQYSPLLGAPNTSHFDAPVSPPASDFRPLPLDYPQIMEIHTDKTSVPVTPTALKSLSPGRAELQLVPAQDSSLLAPIEASSTQTPRPSTQQDAPISYQFPQNDSLLENLMQQVQMGIFALPGKEA